MRYHHPKIDESVNVTPTKPLREFITYMAGILLLITIVYYGSLLLVEGLVPHISTKTEAWIWKHMLEEKYTSTSPRSESIIALEKKIQAMLDRIPKQGLPAHDYKIIVTDSNEANALALPSGKIVIYSGLVESLSSENGLMFVLGHELGHFANRDHLRGMGRTLIAATLLAPIAASGDSVSGIIGSISSGFDMQFSRTQETAADAYGLDVLQATYGHAGGATEAFEHMKHNESSPLWEKLTSTHPISDDRIANLNALIAAKKLPIKPLVALH